MTVGVVAEYNPFHNGHLYQLQEIKRSGGDAVIAVVMSGNAVQRGQLALFEKHLRAEAALRHGADLVVELPVPWALSSAEGFALGAVSLLGALGCDTISFGSECGDGERLRRTAEALASPKMEELIHNSVAGGLGYGEARQAAASAILGEEAELLRNANDLLAVEYLRSAFSLGLHLHPLAIPRTGAAHDGESVRNGFASASHLRRMVEAGEDLSGLIPSDLTAVYASAPRCLREREETMLMGILRTLPVEAFDALPGSAEGFGRRLFASARRAESLEELFDSAKTRRYSHARIRRMVLWAALGMKAGDGSGLPPYLRILGANPRGRALLRDLDTLLPVITKPAASHRMGGRAERVFQLEARVTDLFTLSLSDPHHRRGEAEWRIGPVMI